MGTVPVQAFFGGVRVHHGSHWWRRKPESVADRRGLVVLVCGWFDFHSDVLVASAIQERRSADDRSSMTFRPGVVSVATICTVASGSWWDRKMNYHGVTPDWDLGTGVSHTGSENWKRR